MPAAPETPAPAPDPPAIEEAMRRVAEQDTPANRRALFELLLETTLFAATPAVAKLEGTPAGDGGLTTVESDDGPVLPIFTRVDALLTWRPTGYRPVALPGRTVFEAAARYETARIEVNPASVPRGWISRAEIEALAQGRLPSGPGGAPLPRSEVTVGRAPVRPPEALIEAARRAVDGQRHAVAAWLFAMAKGSDTPRVTVGVQLTGGLDDSGSEATIQAIIEETWARSAEADQLDFIAIDDEGLRRTLAAGAGELIFER